MRNPLPIEGGRKMTVTLYAQPYDQEARGFYFGDFETYKANAANVKNSYGQKVEEFEIQFIDGSDIDYALAKAFGINQANLTYFYDAIEDWNDDEKTRFIIAVGECGYSFDHSKDHPSDFEIDLYEAENMRDFAENYAGDWLLCDVPENIKCYIDYDALARDLAVDYSETTIAGLRYVYRCA
jgi:antirestriction protein